MKRVCIVITVLVFAFVLAACSGGSSSTSTTNKTSTTNGGYSNTSNNSNNTTKVTAGGDGICKYKEGSTYVCTKKATNGNYCKEHYDYLNKAYNDVTDRYNTVTGKNTCYICGKSASQKVGSYWYCSTHAATVKKWSGN